jgi:hypothetical protein
MTEIGIMIGTTGGAGKETEIEIEAVKEIERGIGGIETATASVMTTTTEIETEKEIGMAGKENAGTETVAGTGAVQGAGAGIGEKETVKTESTAGDVAVVAPVLEGVLRMMAGGRNLRRERKRKIRALEMVWIQMIQKLLR